MLKTVSLTRPIYWLPTIGSVLGGYFFERTAFNYREIFMLVLLAGPGLSAFAETFNEIQDVTFDELSKRHMLFGISLAGGTGLLVSKQLSQKTAYFLLAIAGVITIATASCINPAVLFLSLCGLAVGIVYSSNKKRQVYNPLIGQLMLFLGYGPIAFGIGFLTHNNFNKMDWAVVTFALFCGLWVVSVGILADILDYKDNLTSGKRNVVTELGVAKSLVFSMTISIFLLAGVSAFPIVLPAIHFNRFIIFSVGAFFILRGILLIFFYRNAAWVKFAHILSIATEFLFPIILYRAI